MKLFDDIVTDPLNRILSGIDLKNQCCVRVNTSVAIETHTINPAPNLMSVEGL